MLKRSHVIALALVALLTLMVLNLPSRTSARLKSAISGLFLPLFGLAGASQKVSGTAGDAIVPKKVLLKENNALQQENEQLRVQLSRANDIERENTRLRQLVGWQQRMPWKLKLANVITRDPANWWRTIEIDLGSRDGLRENLPVLSPDGYLIGRTATVSLTRSQVVLLGDPNCKVAALVENEARDMGIVGASGPLDGSLITMSYLSSTANVKSGQNVISSGIGSVFPKGITVGKIVDARQVEYGLYTEARVKLAANFSSLEEVWVMFP